MKDHAELPLHIWRAALCLEGKVAQIPPLPLHKMSEKRRVGVTQANRGSKMSKRTESFCLVTLSRSANRSELFKSANSQLLSPRLAPNPRAEMASIASDDFDTPLEGPSLRNRSKTRMEFFALLAREQ
jgi:hypothetical protein